MSPWFNGITQSQDYCAYTFFLDEKSEKEDRSKMAHERIMAECDAGIHNLSDEFFHKLITLYLEESGDEKAPGLTLFAFYIGVYSMQAGIIIREDDKKILRQALEKVELSTVAKTQMEEALENYKNDGEGWDFERLPGNMATLLILLSARG